MDSGNAIGEAEFSALMAPLGNFESRPELAVAVSGGADSMALLLLATRWARRRGGSVCALSVDHGLRKEARGETRQVARWCKDLSITHHTLTWRNDKPESGIPAAAREARYRLLSGYCRRRGILHLLTAHHLEDQAETLLLRLSRQSGMAGMAGMAGVSQVDGARLLRPLLPVRRARLRDTLRLHGQDWLEDPSNHDDRFTRVRLRTALAEASDGEDISRGLAHLARQAGLARRDAGAWLAATAAGNVEIFPAGYARTTIAALQALAPGPRSVLLSALLTCIGGRAYQPDRAAIARLSEAIERGQIRTLHGCLVKPSKSGLLICRESGRLPPALSATSAERTWDRFRITFPDRRSGFRVAALGADGWREIKPHLGETPLPQPVRAGLPALWFRNEVLAVPHLGFTKANTSLPLKRFSAIFTPPRPLLEFSLRVV